MKFKTAMLSIGIVCLLVLFTLCVRRRGKAHGHTKHITADQKRLVYKRMPLYRPDCTFHSCFNVPNCQSLTDNKITIGIHPYDGSLAREHISILRGVKNSGQYIKEHFQACVTILPVGASLESKENAYKVEMGNSSEDRANFLIFDLTPRSVPLRRLRIGQAMVASGAFTEEDYRHTYDVAIPVFNPLTSHLHLKHQRRSRLFVMAQVAIPEGIRAALRGLAAERDDFLVLSRCAGPQSYFRRCSAAGAVEYPQVLKSARFCGVAASRHAVEQTVLFDAMKAGCVPVFIGKTYVLPFSEVLDWRRCSLRVSAQAAPSLAAVLDAVPAPELALLRRHLRHFFHAYMSSARKIAATALAIVGERAAPHAARSHAEWNEPAARQAPPPPLFYPLTAPPELGFTAVILTYNRFAQLSRLLRRLAPTPSLRRIVIVWNNPDVAPPPVAEWPRIGKSVTIVRSLRNSLNNRFTPFEEIATEAVLSMDDDLDMLTPDELEFAFRLWSDHTDRLVGVPGRLHWQDNATGVWRYDSEWKSELSMVLTGAAFFHKYYGYLYRTRMPQAVLRYVDAKMMCEDIAMNFLIAHLSGKAALKVTPRKKFRCPSCLNSSSSLRTVRRLRQRSLCVARFARHFGQRVPMRAVDFRADPLLMGVPGERPVDAYRQVGRV